MQKLKHIIILLILLSTGILYSQVTLTLHQPPAFQFMVENMWKVTLNNTGADVRVYLTGSVMEKNAVRNFIVVPDI